MSDLGEVLTQLADRNHRGAVFLLVYGTTCAAAWLGMRGARPGGESIAQLGLLISMSQLLVLPLLIVLSARGRHTSVPLVFSLAGAVHFVPFAWLYQSMFYIVMPVVLAVGLAVLYGTDRAARDGGALSTAGAGRVCGLTGAALLVTGALAVLAPL